MQKGFYMKETYFNFALAAYKKGRLDEAILHLNKSIKANLRVADAYCVRGCAYQDKGNINQAISDYNNNSLCGLWYEVGTAIARS